MFLVSRKVAKSVRVKVGWKLLACLSLAIAFLPTPVLANAGTALMFAYVLHLIIGNAFIGLIEGELLSRWLHIPRKNTTEVVIIANYASAWGGMLFLGRLAGSLPMMTIENVHIWLYLFIAFAFLLTLIIEYPFFWFLLRKQENSIRKTLKATVIIHSITYLLLLAWYGWNSHTSMLTQLDVVLAPQLQPKEEYVLYFITSEGNQAVRSNLEGKQPEIVEFSEFASVIPQNGDFRTVTQLAENANWEYEISVWAAGGIMAAQKSEDLKVRFALETPFTFWQVSYPTHLPGDFLVFQLGKNQICILHPQERKIALITRGKTPVVVKVNHNP
jgi:hypothetical protein